MLGWYLNEKRVEHIRNKKKPTQSVGLVDQLPIRVGKRNSMFGK